MRFRTGGDNGTSFASSSMTDWLHPLLDVLWKHFPMERIRTEVPTADYWQRQINCQEACPVHTDARGYVRAISEGRFEDAYLIARGPNPLASICGRICGAPCEAACRRGSLDEAVSIRALKRFVTDRFGHHAVEKKWSPLDLLKSLTGRSGECSRQEDASSLRRFFNDSNLPDNSTGERVAIIGSGPAGLAAAHDLALMGFRPTVYEMEPVPAGMLVMGIPEYRLPRDLIAGEVEFIRSLGVTFICNTQVGRDISFEEIRRTHQATIIAVGLKRSRMLDLPGAGGPGVLGGVEFLRDIALGNEIEDLSGDVVVVGGGNVAFDVARSVVRQTGYDISRSALRRPGVSRVHLCSLESLEELPADDVEIIEGDEEGVLRHHSVGPVEIQRGEDGRPAGVVFQRCTQVFDEDGRFAPDFDSSDLITIPADTVIWSIGQQADLSFVEGNGDVELTDRGLLATSGSPQQSTAPDVFLAGDLSYGPKLAIHAVASGKQVARDVCRFIRGAKPAAEATQFHLELPVYARERDYEKLPRTDLATVAPEERKLSHDCVVELELSEPQAVCEGCRCLDCGVNTIFDSAKCILCGGCADVCPELCLQLVSLDRLDGDELLDRAIKGLLGEDASLAENSAIVKDETACIRCALCAERCPTGAITMERVNFATTWNLGAPA